MSKYHDWVARSKLATESIAQTPTIDRVLKAAYCAGHRQGYKDMEQLAIHAIELRDLLEMKTPNDRVEGRDAALSRRVPSHDGLANNANEGTER